MNKGLWFKTPAKISLFIVNSFLVLMGATVMGAGLYAAGVSYIPSLFLKICLTVTSMTFMPRVRVAVGAAKCRAVEEGPRNILISLGQDDISRRTVVLYNNFVKAWISGDLGN